MDFYKRARARANTRMKQDDPTATASPRADSRDRPAAASRRSRPLSGALTGADIVQLQRTLGNRMVGRLLRERRPAPPHTQVSPGAQPGHQPVIQREIIDAWDSYNLQSLRQEKERRTNKGRVRPKGNKYERLTKEELDNLISYHSHNRGVFQPAVAQQQFVQNNLGQQNIGVPQSTLQAPILNNASASPSLFGTQQNLGGVPSVPLSLSSQQNNNNSPFATLTFGSQLQQPLFQTGQASQSQTIPSQSSPQEPLFLPPHQLTAEELGWDPSMMPTDEEIDENANIEWKIKKGSTVKSSLSTGTKDFRSKHSISRRTCGAAGAQPTSIAATDSTIRVGR